MATVQTIATTLTADSRPAVQSLRTFDAEVGKAFSRLDAMNKRAFSSGGIGGAGGIGGLGGGAQNAARGLLELSRGVEDAAVVFGTSGFSGAIRASSNNLSQMAMIMGGPLAGAIAGFAAAGVSIATPYIASLFDATEQTKKLKDETDQAIKSIGDLFESRLANNVRGTEFAFDLKGIGTAGGAASEISQRRRELNSLETREFFNRQQRDAVAAQGGNGAFSKETEEELRRLDKERGDMAAQSLQVQHEITRLKERQVVLARQEREAQAEEFAERIRQFQEEDKEEAIRNRNREIRDNERLENLLQSGVAGLGGKVDPLDDMNVPDALKGRISGLLGEIDALKDRKPGQLAGVATAGSQALLRAQAQAKEAAEAKRQREVLIKRLEDLIREVKNDRPLNPEDDVNLI
jgi:flagellin-like hook-associated protein FlgL